MLTERLGGYSGGFAGLEIYTGVAAGSYGD